VVRAGSNSRRNDRTGSEDTQLEPRATCTSELGRTTPQAQQEPAPADDVMKGAMRGGGKYPSAVNDNRGTLLGNGRECRIRSARYFHAHPKVASPQPCRWKEDARVRPLCVTDGFWPTPGRAAIPPWVGRTATKKASGRPIRLRLRRREREAANTRERRRDGKANRRNCLQGTRIARVVPVQLAGLASQRADRCTASGRTALTSAHGDGCVQPRTRLNRHAPRTHEHSAGAAVGEPARRRVCARWSWGTAPESPRPKVGVAGSVQQRTGAPL